MALSRSFTWLSFAIISATLACSAESDQPGYNGGGGGVGATSGGGGSGGAPMGGGAGGVPSGGSGGLSSGGAAGSGGTVVGGGGSASVSCFPMPACDAPLPTFTKRPWKHSVASPVIVATGFANHRGRDLILPPGMDQWVLGKTAYGVTDKDLKDEEVDIWLNRGCGATWDKLGTVLTTNDGQHPTVEGAEDTGGRVYFKIPSSSALGIGRHRIHMVVAGDLSGTDQYIEIAPPGTTYFITDVDGTLTSKETEEYGALLTGAVSDPNPDAGKALSLLAQKAFRPFYLTARPEFLVGRTREFVDVKGFPLGPVHTTFAFGATGGAAVAFKKGEIDELQGRGFKVAYAFGNTDSDADSFFLAGIKPDDHRIFFQYTDTANGGRRIEAYTELLGEFGALSKPCQ